jgi:hypothetical protein
MNLKNILVISLMSVLFLSCKKEAEKDYSANEVKAVSADFNETLETWFEEDLAESPMFQTRLGRKTNYGEWDDFSTQKKANDLKKAKKRLKYLKNEVDENALG